MWRAPALQLGIVGLAGTIRHVRVQHVGQGAKKLRRLRLQPGRTRFKRFHLAAQRNRLGLQDGRVRAGTLSLADLLGQRIAAGLAILQRGQRGAAFGVERQDLLGYRDQAAARHGCVEGGGVRA